MSVSPLTIPGFWTHSLNSTRTSSAGGLFLILPKSRRGELCVRCLLYTSQRGFAAQPFVVPAAGDLQQAAYEISRSDWSSDVCSSDLLNERKTRKDIIIGIPNRKAETVVKALDALERKCGAKRFRVIFKSITFDNGSEFSAAEELERSAVNKTIPRTKVYFCHPYSSWERGSNENANSMIRRRHPKGTDFSKVSAAEIAATEEWINNYPRKIFGYKSSEVMFRECLREIGLIA